MGEYPCFIRDEIDGKFGFWRSLGQENRKANIQSTTNRGAAHSANFTSCASSAISLESGISPFDAGMAWLPSAAVIADCQNGVAAALTPHFVHYTLKE